MRDTALVIRNKPVVLGLQLSSLDPLLLQTASTLARKLGSSLELVHAVQPVFDFVGSGDFAVNPYHGYNVALSDIEVTKARQKLENVKASLAPDLQIELHIVRDSAPEALLTIGKELNAELIVCGIQQDSLKNFFTGATTAFSLAAESEIPVLIVPHGTLINFNHPIELLVADNLAAEGNQALESAVNLSENLHVSKFYHAHVHKLNRSEISHMVDSIREAMTLGTLANNPEFSVEFYLNQLTASIRENLNQRFKKCMGSTNNLAHYQTEIAFGSPAEEIHLLAQKHQVNIMVFGRHHLLHRQAFAFGKIPHREMMAKGVATLIVPENHQQ